MGESQVRNLPLDILHAQKLLSTWGHIWTYLDILLRKSWLSVVEWTVNNDMGGHVMAASGCAMTEHEAMIAKLV